MVSTENSFNKNKALKSKIMLKKFDFCFFYASIKKDDKSRKCSIYQYFLGINKTKRGDRYEFRKAT